MSNNLSDGKSTGIKTNPVEEETGIPGGYWTREEPDFTHFEPLTHLTASPLPKRISHHHCELPNGKRITLWVKDHFVWVLYLTMIIQLAVNIGVVTTLPAILTSDVRYFSVSMTQHLINSQRIPMLAACVISHLLLGEWYIVRHRSHLEQGDVLGIIGLILLFITAVSIDACRLIQSHIQLVKLRADDGKHTPNYDISCLETYMGLIKVIELDQVTITPVRNLINQYQCCGGRKTLNESRNLFAPLKAANMTTTALTKEGLQCCSAKCECNVPGGNFSICLTKFLSGMGGVYSATYPIYIVFILASFCSISAFLLYNIQVSDWRLERGSG